MSHPRISIFAGSANGNAGTVRTIEGQNTLQARLSHDIAVDPINDEVAVPNPFGQALLFYRGGANGNEAPIRIIQGSKTLMTRTDNIAIDPIHKEVFTAQVMTDAILVFRSDVGGDQAPIRIIHGPKTKLDRPMRITVDPVNNLIAANTATGIWFFNRTDNGDVAPKWILSGPKTGLGLVNGTRKVVLYPPGKKIIAGGGMLASDKEQVLDVLSKDGVSGASHIDAKKGGIQYFIGVWNYGDNGDVAPFAMLRANETTQLGNAHSITINPDDKELISANGKGGSIAVYHVPEIFR